MDDAGDDDLNNDLVDANLVDNGNSVDAVDAVATETITAESDASDLTHLSGRRIVLLGRFGGMNRRQAASVLRSFGGVITDVDSEDIDLVVIGADHPPLAQNELISADIRRAAADGFLEIVPEAELWQRLGLVDAERSVRRYHTPAMLAELLDVNVRVIRRWHRLGLIHAVRTLHKLPYFDFAEVATARRLASWIASGASPSAIERRLVELVSVLPDVSRPLDQLSILVEGKQVLLRHGEGLLEPGGQLRFDFESPSAASGTGFASIDDASGVGDSRGDGRPGDRQHSNKQRGDEPSVLSIWDPAVRERFEPAVAPEPPDALLEHAFDAEDEGDYAAAVDFCHAILARDGPRADIHFQIAELLYRDGEVIAARERYYAAIEHDPDFVEARASLGNVLVETQQYELAIAAYRGALTLHEDYADVHYNLARVMDRVGDDSAIEHWRRFLQLSPASPWADRARGRLGLSDEEPDRSST